MTTNNSERLTTTGISTYVARLLEQEGLYVGLGLGAVAGALAATHDPKAALGKAYDLLRLAERLAAELKSGFPGDGDAQ